MNMNISRYLVSRRFYLGICAMAFMTGLPAVDAVADTTGSKGSLARYLMDKGITFRIKTQANSKEDWMAKSDVNVTTLNGIVLLTGSVKTAEAKLWVEEVSENQEEVRDVVNEIKVGKARGLIKKLRDKTTQTRVKTRITKDIKDYSASIKVVVSYKVVYLMGKIPPDIAEIATEIASKTKNVKRVVTIFELLDPK